MRDCVLSFHAVSCGASKQLRLCALCVLRWYGRGQSLSTSRAQPSSHMLALGLILLLRRRIIQLVHYV